MLPSNNGLKHFHKFLYQICVTQEADLGSLIASRIVRNARHLSLQSLSFKDSCQRSQYLGARCHLLASSSALIQKRDKKECAIGHAVGFRRVTSDSGAILSDLSGISTAGTRQQGCAKISFILGHICGTFAQPALF